MIRSPSGFRHFLRYRSVMPLSANGSHAEKIRLKKSKNGIKKRETEETGKGRDLCFNRSKYLTKSIKYALIKTVEFS